MSMNNRTKQFMMLLAFAIAFSIMAAESGSAWANGFRHPGGRPILHRSIAYNGVARCSNLPGNTCPEEFAWISAFAFGGRMVTIDGAFARHGYEGTRWFYYPGKTRHGKLQPGHCYDVLTGEDRPGKPEGWMGDVTIVTTRQGGVAYVTAAYSPDSGKYHFIDRHGRNRQFRVRLG